MHQRDPDRRRDQPRQLRRPAGRHERRGHRHQLGDRLASARAGGQSGSIGVGFAIPIDQAKRIAQEIIDTGKATHAVLGVSVQDADGTTAAPCSARSRTGSAAQQAGLREGDVITKVGDQTVEGADTLVAAIRSYRPGDKVTLTYTRDGSQDNGDRPPRQRRQLLLSSRPRNPPPRPGPHKAPRPHASRGLVTCGSPDVTRHSPRTRRDTPRPAPGRPPGGRRGPGRGADHTPDPPGGCAPPSTKSSLRMLAMRDRS